ncbi:MAG TPA: tetratricopeptide repeat protein [Kofleriaceae bacterium]
MSVDVQELLAQAYALDAAGDERAAIKLYDAAYRAGVPASQRRKFLVGYGSTLRNVGRSEEAVVVLAQAVADDPGYPAFVAFLALALADAGHPKAALATMLGCALEAARPGAFDGYERALSEYHQLLLEQSQS